MKIIFLSDTVPLNEDVVYKRGVAGPKKSFGFNFCEVESYEGQEKENMSLFRYIHTFSSQAPVAAKHINKKHQYIYFSLLKLHEGTLSLVQQVLLA